MQIIDDCAKHLGIDEFNVFFRARRSRFAGKEHKQYCEARKDYATYSVADIAPDFVIDWCLTKLTERGEHEPKKKS